MSHDEIIDMARQTDMMPHSIYDFAVYVEELEAFAKLVAAKERKRIADEVDEVGDGGPVFTWWVAEQIRTRGEA